MGALSTRRLRRNETGFVRDQKVLSKGARSDRHSRTAFRNQAARAQTRESSASAPSKVPIVFGTWKDPKRERERAGVWSRSGTLVSRPRYTCALVGCSRRVRKRPANRASLRIVFSRIVRAACFRRGSGAALRCRRRRRALAAVAAPRARQACVPSVCVLKFPSGFWKVVKTLSEYSVWLSSEKPAIAFHSEQDDLRPRENLSRKQTTQIDVLRSYPERITCLPTNYRDISPERRTLVGGRAERTERTSLCRANPS